MFSIFLSYLHVELIYISKNPNTVSSNVIHSFHPTLMASLPPALPLRTAPVRPPTHLFLPCLPSTSWTSFRWCLQEGGPWEVLKKEGLRRGPLRSEGQWLECEGRAPQCPPLHHHHHHHHCHCHHHHHHHHYRRYPLSLSSHCRTSHWRITITV